MGSPLGPAVVSGLFAFCQSLEYPHLVQVLSVDASASMFTIHIADPDNAQEATITLSRRGIERANTECCVRPTKQSALHHVQISMRATVTGRVYKPELHKVPAFPTCSQRVTCPSTCHKCITLEPHSSLTAPSRPVEDSFEANSHAQQWSHKISYGKL